MVVIITARRSWMRQRKRESYGLRRELIPTTRDDIRADAKLSYIARVVGAVLEISHLEFHHARKCVRNSDGIST